MVLQLALLVLFGCGEKEEERVVSEDTYPSEYAEIYCRIQVDCERTDVPLAECMEQIQASVQSEVGSGCFDESAAVECLDILEVISCEDFGNVEKNAWSVCGEVDVCS